MHPRIPLTLVGSFFLQLALVASSFAAVRPEIDAVAQRPPSSAARAHLDQVRHDVALRQVGTPAGVEERFGVPTFVWKLRNSTARRPNRT